MKKKIRLVILFGGKSAEHEVSIQSARNIFNALDRNRYEVNLIGINKDGAWHPWEPARLLGKGEMAKEIANGRVEDGLALVPGAPNRPILGKAEWELGPVDVVFPVSLHGPHGEDGTVQGLLKLAGVPFVGAGVLGSAVGMDKVVMKRLLRDAGIPGPDFLSFDTSTRKTIDFQDIVQRLGLPLFVKPANLGSSVGISRATDRAEFAHAVEEAFSFDRKVIVEEGVKGREVECAVLGNDEPIASLPGEVITNTDKHAFYSYEAKYLDEKGALLVIPAKLEQDLIQKVRDLAVQTFKTLCCEGMARVDFFVTEDRRVLVNEINTIPGFTRISMYPKLWEATGIPYAELIDRLIELALERHEKEKRLKTSYDF